MQQLFRTRQAHSRAAAPTATFGTTADVCLIVEGCYPYIRGGVSAWVDWLMRSQPDLTFSVVAIWPQADGAEERYQRPSNLVALQTLHLHDIAQRPRIARARSFDPRAMAHVLGAFVRGGGLKELAEVDRTINAPGAAIGTGDLLNSPEAWEVVRLMYEEAMPQASFIDYFWAWRALFGGLFATLKAPLPPARVYHAISTGYAGVLAARAVIETGRPGLVTEHGIYTNERRIEILMADWLADTVEKGLALHDPRYDLRDMWVEAFEAYAKTCYEAASRIITLYGDNQVLQRVLGARDDQLQVIANGMDWGRFASLPRAGEGDRPTMALIGRVVPIKDVKSYVAAAALLRRQVPNLRALVLGPTDEDPDYVAECRALIEQHGLQSCIELTGNVAIADWLPSIHVVVLTSLSEAQPLVLLEAGAAGVPCVATNVGSCAEILEGSAAESPRLGPGGIVTEVVAPDQVADAVHRLLTDASLRTAYGENLRARVRQLYSNELAVERYRKLYAQFCLAPDRATTNETTG